MAGKDDAVTLVADDISDASTDGKALLTAADKAAQRTALSVREQLTANRTYYVRTDGSDSNDGLSNTAGGAFLTIQKAVDVAATLDFSIYNVTIRCTGNFSVGATIGPMVGSGMLTIRGDADDMTTMQINKASGGSVIVAMGVQNCRIQYMAITSVDSQLVVGAGGYITYGNINFGIASALYPSHVSVSSGCRAICIGPFTISGKAHAHAAANGGGLIAMNSVTATLSGTPNFTDAFVRATLCGSISADGFSYTGSATGRRYSVTTNGAIMTFGGATHFPGNVDGTVATGGQYG